MGLNGNCVAAVTLIVTSSSPALSMYSRTVDSLQAKVLFWCSALHASCAEGSNLPAPANGIKS